MGLGVLHNGPLEKWTGDNVNLNFSWGRVASVRPSRALVSGWSAGGQCPSQSFANGVALWEGNLQFTTRVLLASCFKYRKDWPMVPMS